MTEEELAAVPPWEEYVCPVYNLRMPDMDWEDCLFTAMIVEGDSMLKRVAHRQATAARGKEDECFNCPYHPDSPQLEELEAWRAGRRSNTD